jgi:hypothetical protein
MKKQQKKVSLSRETVRRLDEDRLMAVNGAATVLNCPPTHNVDCSYPRTCSVTSC